MLWVRRLGPVVVVAALMALPGSAAAASAPSGTTGHDVSYPQCTTSTSSTTTVGSLGGQFGIVGVTSGRPWGANPCLSAEYTWASGRPSSPGLYMNTANPAPTSSFYWPTSGASDPALCKVSTSTTDPGCAYDYGWHSARDALTKEAAVVPNAATLTWWLDIETANSWNGDGTSNAADLQGAVDYLRSAGVPAVGLYSTGYQWSTITGGYSTSTVGSYTTAWAPEFTAQYPMTQSPLWIAGLGSSGSASTACGTSFTGGPTQLAQYVDGSGYDADLVCGTATPVQGFTLSLSPTSASVRGGSSASTSVTVAETGASQQVTLTPTGAPPSSSVTFSQPSVSASGSVTLTVATTSATPTGTYSVVVTGTGATGTQRATFTLKVSRHTWSLRNGVPLNGSHQGAPTR